MRQDRKSTSMNLDRTLWEQVKWIAFEINKRTYKMPVDLIEEAITNYILPKYQDYLPEGYKKGE